MVFQFAGRPVKFSSGFPPSSGQRGRGRMFTKLKKTHVLEKMTGIFFKDFCSK